MMWDDVGWYGAFEGLFYTLQQVEVPPWMRFRMCPLKVQKVFQERGMLGRDQWATAGNRQAPYGRRPAFAILGSFLHGCLDFTRS